MANSLMQLVSDGNLSVVPLTIQFFEQSHIKVFINDAQLPDGTYTYAWTDDTVITITPDVAAGAAVTILRKTPNTEVFHDFQAGAVFSELSVDENFRQELYLLQEASEQSFVSDLFTDLNMHGFGIRNVRPATLPGDAVNLGQVQLMADGGEARQLRADLAAVTGSSLIGGLPLDSMYGDLSTTGDNTAAVNERLNWSRTTGKTVEFPAGKFLVAGELELGGVKMRGRSIGYRNSDGTVFVGDGTNTMFKQSDSAFPYFASTKMASIRIENVKTGLDFGYLTRALFEDVHIDSTGTSIAFGRAAQSGPLFNMMTQCTAESDGASALYMNGATWCNNNTFDQCFFESKNNLLIPAVVIATAGGLGAIGNIFPGTEISSEGYGVRLLNARATDFSSTWFECMGPSIWLNGTSYGTLVNGAIFGRQRAINPTGKVWAIYHESGNANIMINKPYITVSDPLTQDGCGFIGFDGVSPPAGLTVDVVADPITENLGGVIYNRYQAELFSKITKVHHGDIVVQSDSSPSLSLQFEDGTKKLELYSNSSKGGSDFGGVLKINDLARMSFSGTDKILLPGQKLGVLAEANVNPPGSKTHRVQLLNESGGFLGYLAVYAT